MKHRGLIVAIVSGLSLFGGSAAAADPIAAFAGATSGASLFRTARQDGELSRLPAGPVIYQREITEDFTRGYRAADQLEINGNQLRKIYDYPANASAHGLTASIRSKLVASGFTTLFECDAQACGDAKGWRTILTNLAVGPDLTQYYTLAQRRSPGMTETLALYVNEVDDRPRLVAYSVVQGGSDAESVLLANAKEVAAVLDGGGRVVASVRFPLASNQPLDTSEIEAASATLLNLSGREVYVVGHTDISGTTELNMRLAGERAKTIAELLAVNYATESATVKTLAVGPFAAGDSSLAADQRRVDVVVR